MLLGDLIYRVGANIQGFETEMSKVSKTLNSLDRASQKALSGFDKVGERLGEVGKIMSASLTLPIAGVGVAATKMAADFDLSMRQVTSLLGDAADSSFKPLSNAVLDLSRKMGIDAVQAAQALYETISADIPQENAISFLETASKAGIAGVTDTKVAVDGLTTVIKAFGLDVSEANKVADAMFQTVNIGKVTFPQLAASIGEAAGIAHQLGISYQELMAAGATITKQGQPIGEAMTQISSAIRAMIDPSETMKTLFAALGVESGKALISANGFEGALQKLREAAGGNVEVLNTAFGRIEGFRAALSLTGNQAKGAAADLDKITNSAGAMGKAFSEIDESTRRQFERFVVQIKDTAIQIGTALLPSVNALLQASRPMVDAIASGVEWFTKLPQPVQTAAFALAAVTAATGPLLYGIGGVVTGLTGLHQAVNFLSKAFPVLASVLPTSAFTSFLPAVKNIAFAVQNDMVAGLTAGETALLALGKAVAVAAAAFAGWKLGEWLYSNVAPLKAVGDAISDFINFALKLQGLPGIDDALVKLTGASSALKTAQESAAFASKKLEEAMARHKQPAEEAAAASQKLAGTVGGQVKVFDASSKAMDDWRKKVAASFKEVNPPISNFRDLLQSLSTDSSLAAAEAELNRIADAARRYREVGNMDAMNRVWSEQPPILAEIEANLSRLPSLVDAVGDSVAGLNISMMTGDISGFGIPKQVEDSWKRTLELTKAGFETNQKQASAWSRQVSTIVSDFGKQTADLFISLFKADPHNEQLKEQEAGLRASLAQREADLAEYAVDIESQIEGLTAKSQEALTEEEDALRASLETKRQEYEAYKSDVEQQIADLTARHEEQADKEVAAAEESLQRQMDAFDEYIRDYQKRLQDLNKREDRSGQDDATRIKRAKEDYEEGLDDQKKALDKNLRDKKQAYDRDTQELQRKIDAELAKGAKANQESISQWRQQLAQKKTDYDDYVADQQGKLQEWIDDHKTALDRELEDIQTAADRRKEDLAEQKQELEDGVTARRNALDAAIAATEEKTAAIRASHAAELAGEIADLNAKLAEKKAALDKFATDLQPSIDALRAQYAAELASEVSDLQAKLKEKSDALETWRTGEYATKLKAIEDDFRGVWDRVGGAFAGMLGSAATAITRFVAESLVGSLFKTLTGDGGLLSHLGRVGDAIAGIFGSGSRSLPTMTPNPNVLFPGGNMPPVPGLGGAAGGLLGSLGSIGSIAGGIASVIGLFHSPLSGDMGKVEVTTREIKAELMNFRTDAWTREEHLMLKLDDLWGALGGAGVNLGEALRNIYDRMGEVWTSVNQIRDNVNIHSAAQATGLNQVVAAINSLKDATLKVSGTVNVGNVGDISASLRMAGMVSA